MVGAGIVASLRIPLNTSLSGRCEAPAGKAEQVINNVPVKWYLRGLINQTSFSGFFESQYPQIHAIFAVDVSLAVNL